jgi:gluconate 5-dehydrogenase
MPSNKGLPSCRSVPFAVHHFQRGIIMAFELLNLSGRVALVTGSSKGIGFAIAEGLASAGAKVALNARDAEPLEAARARLAAKGHTVSAEVFDVTDDAAVGIGQITSAHGGITSVL